MSEPKRYRKKPVVIEAIQWTGTNDAGVMAFVPIVTFLDGEQAIVIETLEGRMRANAGDYIIRGVEGEFYPCKASIFERTYEEAEA